MDSEIRNITNTHKLPNKYNSNKNESETEIQKEKEKPKKVTRLKIKNFLKGKRKKPKNNNHINVNYSKSNCLSRLLFFWPSQIFKISNKGTLTHEDVCNISEEQSIKHEIEKIKTTFLKYNSSRLKNFSLVITIFLSNCKLLFFLFIIPISNFFFN